MVDKEQEVEKEKSKKEEPPFWKNLHPVVLIGGIFLIGILFINISKQENSNAMFWLILVVAVIYILGQNMKRDEPMLDPREAELLVERDFIRKQRWGQISTMSKYKQGIVNPLHHKDAKGVFYEVAVEIDNPYELPEYYTATVMPKGIEKGFVTWKKSIGPMHGRERVDEKSPIPTWVSTLDKYPFLKDMWQR